MPSRRCEHCTCLLHLRPKKSALFEPAALGIESRSPYSSPLVHEMSHSVGYDLSSNKDKAPRQARDESMTAVRSHAQLTDLPVA